MLRKSFKDSVPWSAFQFVFLLLVLESASANKEGYYGKFIGKLSQLHHGVSGDVFAVDARTLHLRNFNYDGEGPAAYFYAGSSKAPGAGGFRVRDERGTTNVLPRYRNKHITITLPEGQTLQNIRWFSVWCDEFSVNFGDVKIPKNLDFPKPQKINGLSGVHGVSSEPIVIVDAQTLLVPSFSYDGEAPDAKFWVGRGFKPSPQGIRIPDENGKEVPLRRYDRKTIVLTLPGDLTIFDIGHFGVWCEAFTVDFGHVQIPRGLNIPPSLKMLGVSPQSKLNCEVLWDDFAYEVRWAVAGDSIVLQLVARLENNEYMSFGISGDKGRSRMVGGDVVVAWVDKESLKGYAMDYYLDAKSQCSGGRGSCPDENIIPGTDSVRLLNAALVNGYSIVTYQRSLKDQDELDKPVLTNGSQPIIWAIGPLNSRKEVSYHTLANRGDIFIDFGRSPKWNCPTPESASEQTESEDAADADREYVEAKLQDARSQLQDAGRRESRPKTTVPTPAPAPKTDAWEIPAIKCYEPEDGVFYAQMGPTGGKHGYSAITGHVGWGISWYINGLLIPEINVVRGRTYTFIVEGGLDPETPARYHPFYITDDPVGGYQYKTPQERANIQIFAGAVQNKRGEVRPTGVGRLCNWTPDPNQPPADEFSSFGAYQRTLRLECDPGNPGIIQWTVDKDTPDTVYYQCYTHRYLGWKINVHDHCEGEAASDPVPSIVKAPSHILKPQETDSESSESVNYEVRVKPDDKFLENLFEKNQTFGFNEFVGHKHRPDFLLSQENEKIIPTGGNPQKIKPEEPLTNPNSNYQVIENFNTEIPHSYAFHVPHAFPQHGQNEWLLHRQVINNSDVNIFGNKLPSYSKVPNLPVYGVRENPTEGNTQQIFQNFQIVPAIATLPSLLPAKSFQNYMIKTSPLPQEIQFAIPAIQIPEKNENPSQLPKFYQNLNEQKEEKIKKVVQKFEGNPKLTKGQSLSLTNRQRRPQPPQVLTFNGQQRPMSPSAFRPPRPLLVSHKPLKLPTSISHQKPHHPLLLSKIPSYSHRPGSGIDPEEFKNKEFKKTQQLKLQHYNHKQQQGPTFTQEARPSNLFSVTVANQQNPKELPFARNSGFDPESVQVEGGFKPILNTAIAPKFGVQPIDRIDVEAEDDIGGNTGAADQVTKDHSRNLLRHAQDKTYANPEEGEDKREENQDRTVNLFQNLKSQTFEPIFVPSFPDEVFKNIQENRQKKPLPSLNQQNDPFQYFESKNTKQIYGKIRSEGTLHPRHVVSPFQDGVFQKRNEQQRQSELELTKVNNVTLARGEGAKNIFEVMKGFEEDANSTPRKKSSPAEDADEIAMADERKDFYLPPKPDQFLSYDGKLVKADLAPSLPAAGRLTDVSKLPQFVPFRGAVPPLDQTVNVKNLPQLRTSKLARHDILPPSQIGQARPSKRHLDYKEDISKGWLNSQGDEVQRRLPGERSKRSPDHIPGHEGHHHDHDHDHDHGDHHNHHLHSSSSTTAASLSIIGLLSVIFPFVQFHILL